MVVYILICPRVVFLIHGRGFEDYMISGSELVYQQTATIQMLKKAGRPSERLPDAEYDNALKEAVKGVQDLVLAINDYLEEIKANKEIQKQLCVSVDNVDLFKPLNKRRRRPGILGRTYKYKHRYNEDDYTSMLPQVTVNQDISSSPKDNSLENLVPLMPSQKTVDEGIQSAPKVNSQENLVHQDPNPDADLEEVELGVRYMKKTNNEDSDLLEELLSCNYEVLEGDGAMNLLQERLNIKTYDRESLPMTDLPPEFGRTSISTVSESHRKLGMNSLVIDSVLKNLSKKSTTIDPSPSPPRPPP
ncbi:hypothetical protein CASFOL_025811 [Castilleja foliolosa]|uniref:Uncharacterized protein n=1 Tax=Castilleja foliolosa TaxID=1961234 RepID=A0ABD3CTK8_9LAMI